VNRSLSASTVRPAAIIGVVTSLVIWWLWGHTMPRASIHDEAAYLLQARIFATGACTAPAAPAPEFFEQFHVIVTPFVAAKYLPGHSLVLTLGSWLGAPVIVPLLLTGIAGGLIFLLVRTIVDPLHASLAWALWMLAPSNTFELPSYLSENTTLVLGLAAWGALLLWCRSGRQRWLYFTAGCLGWAAITRPLTALVWALPVTGVVLMRAVPQRQWRPLTAAAIVFLTVLAMIPLWNHCATGSWDHGPLTVYRAAYMPWDRLGFGLDSTPPKRSTQPDLEALANVFRPLHRELTPASYWRIFGRRVGFVGLGTFGLSVFLLLPLTLVGMWYSRLVWVPTTTLLLMFAGYGLYASPITWTAYYVEVLPVLVTLSVCGAALVWRAATACSGRAQRVTRALGVCAYAAIVATIVLGVLRLPDARARSIQREAWARSFDRAILALPLGPSIVFVKYSPEHNVHRSFVQNDPFFARSRVWVAFDRGDENARLLRLAPFRKAYLYDEASGRLIALARPVR